MSKTSGFTSQIVHHDYQQGVQQGSHYGAIHTPVYNSVPYGYAKAEDIMEVFQGKAKGHAYARQSTPSTDSLQHLIAQMEQSIGALCFATGMAAISAACLSLLKSGDHIICSQYLFGNSYSFFTTLRNFGIEVSFVDATETEQVKQAVQPNTRIVFVETIANPGTQIADLEGIGAYCSEAELLYIVDNTMTSSYLFQPKEVQAHLIITSLSKYVSGHGQVLGGVVSDTGLFDWESYPNIFVNYQKGDRKQWGLTQIKKKSLRDMGATLSSDSAYQISLASETIALRMDRSCSTALKLARLLDIHPKVKKVYYPGLSTHPQYETAKKWFKHFGALLSFDLADGTNPADFLNALNLVITATHLGDNRTLALPMAQTIFFEMGAEMRQQMGVGDAMIRCSVGIEDEADLLADFEAALATL